MEHTFKKKFRRILSLILVIMMVVPFTVFELGTTSSAAEGNTPDKKVSLTNWYAYGWSGYDEALGTNYDANGISANESNNLITYNSAATTYGNVGYNFNAGFLIEAKNKMPVDGLKIDINTSNKINFDGFEQGSGDNLAIGVTSTNDVNLVPYAGNAKGVANVCKGTNDVFVILSNTALPAAGWADTVKLYKGGEEIGTNTLSQGQWIPFVANTNMTIELKQNGENKVRVSIYASCGFPNQSIQTIGLDFTKTGLDITGITGYPVVSSTKKGNGVVDIVINNVYLTNYANGTNKVSSVYAGLFKGYGQIKYSKSDNWPDGVNLPISSENILIGDNASLTAPSPKSKDIGGYRYTWLGWYDGSSKLSSLTVTGNKTLYGKWNKEEIKYNITTKTNGNGSVSANPTSVGAGKTSTITATPNSGYKFSKWTVSGTGAVLSSTTINPTTLTMGNADATVTCTFAPITYTVAYDSNGGSGTMSSDTNREYGTAYTVQNNTFTAPAGMEFDSWNTEKNGTGTKYAAGSQYSNLTATDGATVTLYAQWKKSGITVTLDSGNFGNATSYQVTVPEGESVTLVGADNAVFNAGGYGNANKSNREATKQSISSAYGGIGVDSTKSVVKTDKYTSGNYAQLTWGNTAWFIGWNTKADGSGEWLTTLDGTVTTVCAVWGWPVVWNTSGFHLSSDYDIQKLGNTPSKVITWTYASESNGAARTLDGKTYNYGQSFNTVFGQPYPGSLQRDGYVADGGNTPFWLCFKAKTFTTEGAEQYLTPYGVYAMELEDAYHTDENGMLEFMAIWKPKIVYKANGGTGSDIVEVLARVGEPAGATENQTFAGGIFNPSFSDYYAKDSGTYSKEGHELLGWSTNPSAVSPEYTCGAKIWSAGYATGDNFKPLTLYAVWGKASYNVTLTLNGGTVNQGNVTSYTYGTGATLPTDVTKTGYTFGGWYESSSFTGDRIYSIASNATGNKTYYAKWTVNTYTVTYHANNGTDQTATGTKTYGTPYTVIECPFAYSGYVFTGWNTASDGSGTAYTVNAQYTENAPIDLYAQWKKLNLTVSGAASDDIKITYYDADGNLITKDNAPGEETAYNAKITSEISLEYTKQDLFYCWVNESGKVLSTQRDFTYTMYTPMEIRVCHDSKDDGQQYGLVVFLSYDDQVISANAYTSDAFTEDIYNSVSKPTRLGYSFNGWDKTVDEIKTEIGTASGSVVVKATYTENAEQYSVRYTYAYTETNSKSEEFSYSLGESSYRAANKVTGSYYFDRWEILDGGVYRVFSYNPGVALRRMTNDTVELVARYVDSEESLSPKQAVVNKPLAYSSYDSSAQKKKAQFVVEYALPENYVIVEMGVLYATKSAYGTVDTLKLANDYSLPGGVYKYTSEKSVDGAKLFGTVTLTLNFKSTVSSGTVYGRGYIIYKVGDSDEIHIAYSDGVNSVDVGAISTN